MWISGRIDQSSNNTTISDLKSTNVSKIESVPGKIGASTSGNIDEFDLLAQSRTTDGTATLKKDSDFMAKETEFDEMAAWLKNNVRNEWEFSD